MYYYIYDVITQHPRYTKEMTRIESRLMDIGIKDRIAKLSPLRNVRELVADAYKQGFETIVAVGEDSIVHRVLNVIAGFPFVFGVIPIGAHTHLATLLGVEYGVAACDILSGRKTLSIDFGKCNDTYFLNAITLPPTPITLVLDDSYQISCPRPTAATIINMGEFQYPPLHIIEHPSPHDGIFNVYLTSYTRGITRKKSSYSTFIAKKIALQTPESIPVHIDGVLEKKTPIVIEVAKQQVRMIVGKHRSW